MIKYRFYLCPLIGTGKIEGFPKDPFRSKLNNYITGMNGGFQSCIFPLKRMDLNTAWTEDAIHDQIDLDAEILALSPRRDSLESLILWLDESGSDLPPPILTAIEGKKINMGWFTGSHIKKDFMRYLRKVSMIEQLSRGTWADENVEAVKILFTTDLDVNVSSISIANLNKLKTWMQNKGLAVGWIKSNTKIREIEHFMTENLGLPQATLSLGINL